MGPALRRMARASCGRSGASRAICVEIFFKGAWLSSRLEYSVVG
jgi:hypothetical protein